MENKIITVDAILCIFWCSQIDPFIKSERYWNTDGTTISEAFWKFHARQDVNIIENWMVYINLTCKEIQ